MTSPPSDCLVLRIIESDTTPRKFDQDVFILHDIERDMYLIRGKRSDMPRRPMKPYTLECSSAYDAAQFIAFIIPPENKCVVELYSLEYMPIDSSDITYEYLSLHIDPAREVVAYSNQYISAPEIVQLFRNIREVANNY